MARADSCPIDYRYRPRDFSGPASLSADVVYAVGGLYGNPESLRTVLAMKRDEERRSGVRVQLVFNGDFHWLDCDDESFSQIDDAVAGHFALRGNVETELARASDGAGCGCGYPDYVDDEVVRLSDEVMQRLAATAQRHPQRRRRLAGLPTHCVAEIGGRRVAIVHGDAESLAGWRFAVEAMPRSGSARASAPCGASPEAAETRIASYFDDAQVIAFACTHTGLPFMQDFRFGDRRRLIANNGAAGLPNFAGEPYGLLTRIAAAGLPRVAGVYGTEIEGLRFDALAIRYDAAAWWARFSRNWPPGSAGRRAYGRRIESGPDFDRERARRFDDRCEEGTRELKNRSPGVFSNAAARLQTCSPQTANHRRNRTCPRP